MFTKLSKKIYLSILFLILLLNNFFISNFLFSKDINNLHLNKSFTFNDIKNFKFQTSYENFLKRNSYLNLYFRKIYNEIFLNIGIYKRFNDAYLYDDVAGFVPTDSLNRISHQILNSNHVNSSYKKSAIEMKVVTELLKKYNTNLIVVLPPNKGKLYRNRFKNIIPISNELSYEYSYFLKQEGINVIDMDTLKQNYHINDFYSKTGFHWNFYASCFATKEIFLIYDNFKQKKSIDINCSNFIHKKAHSTDIDISAMFPMFSDITSYSIYPEYSAVIDEIPNIIIIGDSYSDQIITTLTSVISQNVLIDKFRFYDYFEIEKKINKKFNGFDIKENIKKSDQTLFDITNSDLIILVISEANILRSGESGFGLYEYLNNKIN